MRKIILVLFFISAMAFGQEHEKLWEKVILLETEGKIKSANEIVAKIYKNAVSKADEPTIIKCFFYRSKYLQQTDEEALQKILINLDDEISRSSIPGQAILNLIYAKSLSDYLNANGYLLYSRTPINAPTSANFLTWTRKDFETQIQLRYANTLQHQNILKDTKLQNYEIIFDYLAPEKFKKETLYDYLLKKTIFFRKHKVSSYLLNQDSFMKDKSLFFSNTAIFTTTDTTAIPNSELRKVFSLYQKQEAFNPSVENQLERLSYFEGLFPETSNLFLKALESLLKTAVSASELQDIRIQKAYVLNKMATKETFPDYRTKAVAILDSIIDSDANPTATSLARLKKTQITSKTLEVSLLKYIYPNQPTRTLVRHTNVDHLKIAFYKIDQIAFTNVGLFRNRKRDSLMHTFISNNKPVQSVRHPLENKKDYFSYTTELLMPTLETGRYLVCFESENTTNSLKATTFEIITVSNLAVLSHTKDDKICEYAVIDRQSGHAVKDATIKTKTYEATTDADGKASDDSKKSYQDRFPVLISKERDSLMIWDGNINNLYSYENTSDGETTAKVQFYTDRAIYRPGQEVFYKGIAVQKKDEKTSVVPNITFLITANNASGSELMKTELMTNAYGSFSGKFTIPKDGLTGSFTLEAEEPDDLEKLPDYNLKKDEHPFWDQVDFNYSAHQFSVEEYKRPTFEVQFKPIRETFALRQKITVRGEAKAFSGSKVSDAKVVYTVTREIANDFKSYHFSNSETIAEGETKTAANGEFEVSFTAEPSEESDANIEALYRYTVNADVTDLNAETRTGHTNLNIGERALALKVHIPEKIDKQNITTISWNSTNLNHEFVAADAEINIYFKGKNQATIKKRMWDFPEIQTIPEPAFRKLFPYETYENPKKHMEKGVLVYTKKVNTLKEKSLSLDFLTAYQNGQYELVLSANDANGKAISDSNNFELFDSKARFSENEILSLSILNKEPQKDGFVLLQITSIIPDLMLFVDGNYRSNKFFEKSITLKDHQAIMKMPLDSKMEFGIKISAEGIFDNEHFFKEFPVEFKEINPVIEFETVSFRNKIEPGSTENWSFRIKDKTLAKDSEILASMYDRSLDNFIESHWYMPEFYVSRYNYVFNRTALGFESVTSSLKNLNPKLIFPPIPEDASELMWFGFNFQNSDSENIQDRYKKQLSKKSSKPKNAKLISGIVTEGGIPVPTAIVLVKNSSRMTQTDFDGQYSIEAGPEEILIFSFLGMKSKEVPVNYMQQVNVSLENDAVMLEGVVVTAAGMQHKKKSLGYAVTNMEHSDLKVGIDALQMLNGRVAGVNIFKSEDSDQKISIRGSSSLNGGNNILVIIDGVPSTAEMLEKINASEIVSMEFIKGIAATALYGAAAANGAITVITKTAIQELSTVKARKNLQETAFFFPHLTTDEKGKFGFGFTSPEALTSWKMRLFAHNKKAIGGYMEQTVVTQKDLMLTPNFPRFLREKDTITVTSKIANMTDVTKSGMAVLQLFDATNMQPLDAAAFNENNIRNFNIAPFGNTVVSWKIVVPQGLQGLQYKVLARSGNFSDGEENILPVLTNNMLVTESLPVWVREKSTKKYVFENLLNNTSPTLKNQSFTFEYTTNPSWIALKSLPYLMEFEHECAEQTFARFYANALAADIITRNPEIATVFETWKKSGKPASPLAMNAELKSVLLAETPWLADAESEEEQRKNLALLFDLENMKNTQAAIFEKLQRKQLDSGGFAWFDGGSESEYITRHIMAGLGHLKKLGLQAVQEKDALGMIRNGIAFLDQKLESHYKTRSEQTTQKVTWKLSYDDLHFLYMRSFFIKEQPINEKLSVTIAKNLENLKTDFTSLSLYQKGLAALALHRFGETASAKKIIESLKETAANNDDWGMYWIQNKSGWHWHQAPIETQALLIEAFLEVSNDVKSAEAMKVWLLKNKQTKNWPTTKSTTEAIYALLMNGKPWTTLNDNTKITIGNEKILTKKLQENQKETASGYMKLRWNADEINTKMAHITVENKSETPAFGGVFWQYFEDLDQIKSNSAQVMSVTKELYLKKKTASGEKLEKITAEQPLQTGDLVTVRLLISSKEDMEFVHLKDMRASCFEPVTTLSGYEWKSGLGFYKSTKDIATHFFFDAINKGTYVLEYDLRVNNSGAFSNGITTIQSMYAPEFTSHTKGIRVTVKE